MNELSAPDGNTNRVKFASLETGKSSWAGRGKWKSFLSFFFTKIDTVNKIYAVRLCVKDKQRTLYFLQFPMENLMYFEKN